MTPKKVVATPTMEEVNDFLDGLRESGVTNMFGASSYLVKYFGVDVNTAHRWLGEWMRTFSERHPTK